MRNPIASEFLFALVNPGSERALKSEAAAMESNWRPSYQRRGFVTFKATTPISLEALHAPLAFARRLCLSLGKASSSQEATQRIGRLTDVPIIHHARFHERKMQGYGPSGNPSIGTLVGTVVELGPTEFWAGIHRHAPFLSPDPAGDSGMVMPQESPSRAWLKLEEAVRFFGLELTPADIVVEVGCAPGGVVHALLQRGIPVVGVDPAKMADIVTTSAIGNRDEAPQGRPWFFHCQKPAALASKRDLGQGVTWFMSDMNQSPEVVIKECARFCKMAPTIRGALITLKLTDLSQIDAKRQWFAQLEAMGFRTVRLQQLSVHHKECALLGLK